MKLSDPASPAAGDRGLVEGTRQPAPSMPALLGRAMITLYQQTLGPLIPSSCRFIPSCSRYAHEALGTHGFFKGSWMAIKRIGRCQPLAKGGFDPVPERKA